MVKTLTDQAVSNFKLPVEQSLSALIVPDTLGVLKPNEIFISHSSTNLINPRTQRVGNHAVEPLMTDSR